MSTLKPSIMTVRMLWIMLLFSAYGLLHGYPDNRNQAQFLQKCCEEGMGKAEDGQDCSLYLLTSHPVCSMVSEQCCKTTLKVILCDKGIKMARQKHACETSFFEEDIPEVQSAKMCCDCCTLGITLSNKGLSCNLLDLFLEDYCKNVALSCCSQNTTEATPILSGGNTPPSKSCAVIKCAHLCVDDGVCTCKSGYQLQEDGVNCKDINECRKNTHNCEQGQACLNTEGSFQCQSGTSCEAGFELTGNNTCKDIDECYLGTDNCGSDLLCNNTEGSFDCLTKGNCAEGFIRDTNKACIDVNECLVLPDPCAAAHTCINTIGSFNCRSDTDPCGPGYLLTVNGICEDLDECQLGHVCGSNKCMNSIGSFYCECRAGYVFNKIFNVCEDINECMNSTVRLCAQDCVNTEGSFKCSCSSGFKLAHNDKSCEDIDECETYPCSQECVNGRGSYHCYCRQGYRLSNIDRKTCEDIDECASSTGHKLCSHYCINTLGSYNCTCPPEGFTHAHDGVSCQDVDECAAKVHTCSDEQTCLNLQGGFRCLSFHCPKSFERIEKKNEGDLSLTVRCVKACQPEDMDCHEDPTHVITHSVLILPIFDYLDEPEEMIMLRTVTPANPDEPHAIEVFFAVITNDEHFSFDVVKRTEKGMVVGIVRQLKPIHTQKDIVLEIGMNYVKSGVVFYKNYVLIHVFISKYWPLH